MVSLGTLGATALFVASLCGNALVLAYRWPRLPSIRRVVDRLRFVLTGRPDWGWLRLRHLLFVAGALVLANLVWMIPGSQCSLDPIALYASGRAVLHGQTPFLVNACGFPSPDPIPYGGAAVLLDTVGALLGLVVGVWIVWQLVALAVIPLVWRLGGEDRRYVGMLALTSVLYLPNLATRIDGQENVVVGLSVLLVLASLGTVGARRSVWAGVGAFLGTARFPAFPPLLAATLTRGGGSRRLFALVVGVGAATTAACYALWGWVFVRVVYLDQFTRVPAQSFNEFDLLLRQGWVHPSIALAATQGVALVAVVAVAAGRGYSPLGAAALTLVAVMLTTQYAMMHFDVWLLPLILLGASVNRALLLYGALWYLDAQVAIGYLGVERGLWWPAELVGVALAATLVYVLVVIVRQEERGRSRPLPSGPAAGGGTTGRAAAGGEGSGGTVGAARFELATFTVSG